MSVERISGFRDKRQLFVLSGLLAAGALVYVWYHRDAGLLSFPEVLLPFAVGLALGIYAVYLDRGSFDRRSSRATVRYAWAGAALAGGIGLLELGIHVSIGLPVDAFPELLLTLVSVGVLTGVVASRGGPQQRPGAERDRIVHETTWIETPGEAALLRAIAEALAEVEDVDPAEIDPLYEHIDPETLSRLYDHDGSPWQLTFYPGKYEVRVSSSGTVSIFEQVVAGRST